jgi:hypothetical protein
MWSRFTICECGVALPSANVESLYHLRMWNRFTICECGVALPSANVESLYHLRMWSRFTICECGVALPSANVESLYICECGVALHLRMWSRFTSANVWFKHGFISVMQSYRKLTPKQKKLDVGSESASNSLKGHY